MVSKICELTTNIVRAPSLHRLYESWDQEFQFSAGAHQLKLLQLSLKDPLSRFIILIV